MLSLYSFITATEDSSHVVQDVKIRDQHTEFQRVRTLIDRGAASIYMALQHLNRLGLPHEAALIKTRSTEDQGNTQVRKRRERPMKSNSLIT